MVKIAIVTGASRGLGKDQRARKEEDAVAEAEAELAEISINI